MYNDKVTQNFVVCLSLSPKERSNEEIKIALQASLDPNNYQTFDTIGRTSLMLLAVEKPSAKSTKIDLTIRRKTYDSLLPLIYPKKVATKESSYQSNSKILTR